MFTFGRANPVSDRNRYTGAKYKIFLLECPENAKTIMQKPFYLQKNSMILDLLIKFNIIVISK